MKEEGREKIGVGHMHFLSKLGVGRVSLSSKEGGGGCIVLIERHQYQTKSRISKRN